MDPQSPAFGFASSMLAVKGFLATPEEDATFNENCFPGSFTAESHGHGSLPTTCNNIPLVLKVLYTYNLSILDNIALQK